MQLRALALISGAAALSTPRGAAKGLAVRGGGLDVEQIASCAARKSTLSFVPISETTHASRKCCPSTPSTRRVPARQRSGAPASRVVSHRPPGSASRPRASSCCRRAATSSPRGRRSCPATRNSSPPYRLRTPTPSAGSGACLVRCIHQIVAVRLITAALSHRWGLNHCFLSILKLQAINQKVWSGA